MRSSLVALLGVALGAAACASAPPVTTVQLAPPPPPVPIARDPEPPAAKEHERPRAPKDYVEMSALRVEPATGGAQLLLSDESRSVVLPLFIGGTEGMSIQLRLEKERYVRPLTHDLLDAAVRELGGEVWKVHIDELRQGTFIGRVYLRQGDRIIDLDARASDAVALALGNRVPIYVARRVLEEAGVRRDDAGGAPAGGEPAVKGGTRPPGP